MSAPLLVLFDMDGTLLVDDAYAHGRAMIEAMRSVYGVALGVDAVQQIGPWGKTDVRIAREVLRGAGVDDATIDSGLGAWMEAAAAAFVRQAAESESRWRVRDGLLRGLRQLARGGLRLTLLTGNLRAIAAAKVELMGIVAELELPIGAYGEDAEDRAGLVPIARDRAGSSERPWPQERTAVVGDTPYDVAAARADSVSSVVFSSLRFSPTELGDADAVVSRMDELVDVLLSWEGDGADP